MASIPDFSLSETKMPALFLGHGTPMNAIEDNVFSQAWQEAGRTLPRPQAILCISAHWETRGVFATAMPNPRTIHDFGGFPQELFDYQYPAPGSPELVHLISKMISQPPVYPDQRWGLDHGTWSVLRRLFPDADVPVVQLSLDQTRPAQFHYDLGKALSELRRRGVLIVGSGNIVHNLRLVRFQGSNYDWAESFDQTVRDLILSREHAPLIDYASLGNPARLSIPTNEHYLPLLYILGLQEPEETLRFFAEGIVYGSLSMRSIQIG